MESSDFLGRYGPTLSIVEAAEVMKVHSKTVEDMIKAGTLPAAKIGRAYVMLTSAVLAYVEHAIAEQTAERMGLQLLPRRVGKRGATKGHGRAFPI